MGKIQKEKTSARSSKTVSSPSSAACYDPLASKRAGQAPTYRKTHRATTTSKTKFTTIMKVWRRTKNRPGSCLRKRSRRQVRGHATPLLWSTTSRKYKRKWSGLQWSWTTAAQWAPGMQKQVLELLSSSATQVGSLSRANHQISTGQKLPRLDSTKWAASASSNNPIQT